MVHATDKKPSIKEKPFEFQFEPSLTWPNTKLAECLLSHLTSKTMDMAIEAKTGRISISHVQLRCWAFEMLTIDGRKPLDGVVKPLGGERTDQAHENEKTNGRSYRVLCRPISHVRLRDNARWQDSTYGV